MPRHVVQLVQDGLNTHRKPVNGSRVLVLGVAYKRDINDVRESPALGIVDQLLHKGAEVSYHDPFVATMTLDGRGSLAGVPLDDETLSASDCVVIVTDHSDIDYARVLKLASSCDRHAKRHSQTQPARIRSESGSTLARYRTP